MKKLIVASHNPKKLKELKEILAPLGYELIGAGEANLPDVEETEDTFIGNATLKVKSAFTHTNTPSIADDSGFCVDALKGAPGVYSARYEGGYQRVLDEIKHLNQQEDRTAHFYCVISYIDAEGHQHNFEGKTEGYIPFNAKGDKGFAYDPIFMPKDHKSTFAEMTAEEKHKLSHRGKALQKFIQHLKKEV
ncbi:MAG: Non-canonical purine NTP pyrophosphatase [Proteobacteria bacterium]|nr:MAG: Non-canonical purine NTP pyrophosphatase [Pseudomonadota bacterium]